MPEALKRSGNLVNLPSSKLPTMLGELLLRVGYLAIEDMNPDVPTELRGSW